MIIFQLEFEDQYLKLYFFCLSWNAIIWDCKWGHFTPKNPTELLCPAHWILLRLWIWKMWLTEGQGGTVLSVCFYSPLWLWTTLCQIDWYQCTGAGYFSSLMPISSHSCFICSFLFLIFLQWTTLCVEFSYPIFHILTYHDLNWLVSGSLLFDWKNKTFSTCFVMTYLKVFSIFCGVWHWDVSPNVNQNRSLPPKAHVPLSRINDIAPFLSDPGPVFTPSPFIYASPLCLQFCTTWVIRQANSTSVTWNKLIAMLKEYEWLFIKNSM